MFPAKMARCHAREQEFFRSLLERLSPIPSDAVGLTLGQAISGGTVAPTAQNAFTFYGGTTGTYEILASVVSGSAYNVCFAVYEPGGTSTLSGNPFCTFVHNGVVSTETNLTPSKNGTYLVVVYTGPRADELVGPNDGTVNYSLSVTCLTTCPNAPPPACVLTETPTYDATSAKLTMNFTIGTPAAATWNGWLTSESTMQQLWSQSQPKTEPAVSVTKTHSGVTKAGKIGILSTLTTASGGITCASWQTVNTGTP